MYEYFFAGENFVTDERNAWMEIRRKVDAGRSFISTVETHDLVKVCPQCALFSDCSVIHGPQIVT